MRYNEVQRANIYFYYHYNYSAAVVWYKRTIANRDDEKKKSYTYVLHIHVVQMKWNGNHIEQSKYRANPMLWQTHAQSFG